MIRYYLKTLITFAGGALLVLGSAHPVVPEMFAERRVGFCICLGFVWLGIVTTHALFTRWVKGPERWRVRQDSELVVALPAAEALERCTAAVKHLPHLKRVRLAGETIEARTGVTWESFGERIRCRVIPVDEQQTRVLVSSRPVVPTTVADYGRNWANVVLIRRELAAQVSG